MAYAGGRSFSMNRDHIKGFGAGLLTAVLILGLGGAAVAARNIAVDDGIAVTINGVPFTPKDANGQAVSLFAYNGTTYAPIRAFSEAAGLLVDYDADKGIARIETPDYAAQSDPAYSTYIGVDKARELALADAGVAAGDTRILKSCLDWEDGRAVYEVEFCSLRSEYDYELDAATGAILKKELDLPDFDWSCHDDYRISQGWGWRHDESGWRHNGNGHHGQPDWAGLSGSGTNPAGLITQAKAVEIAAGRLDGSVYTVDKCELDFDDGRWVYEVELRSGWSKYECDIDAASGTILKWEKDA